MDKLPLTLAMFVRNEEKNLRDAIESVYPIVREVIIVDGMSEDKTVEIAKKYTDRIYKVPFPGSFGDLRTLTAHLATSHWVLMLDADERISSSDWYKFPELISQEYGTEESGGELGENTGEPIIDSWAFPRKRWADVWLTKQIDSASYPDWQVRLFRNHVLRRKIKFERRVHEKVKDCVRTEKTELVTIQHLQNVNKTEQEIKDRSLMYQQLWDKDIEEGIIHEEPPYIKEDFRMRYLTLHSYCLGGSSSFKVAQENAARQDILNKNGCVFLEWASKEDAVKNDEFKSLYMSGFTWEQAETAIKMGLVVGISEGVNFRREHLMSLKEGLFLIKGW